MFYRDFGIFLNCVLCDCLCSYRLSCLLKVFSQLRSKIQREFFLGPLCWSAVLTGSVSWQMMWTNSCHVWSVPLYSFPSLCSVVFPRFHYTDSILNGMCKQKYILNSTCQTFTIVFIHSSMLVLFQLQFQCSQGHGRMVYWKFRMIFSEDGIHQSI